jgi:hypothetical protein
MEKEIQRWRNLATLQEHHHPDEKIEMVRAKRHLKSQQSRVDNKSQPKTILRATAKQRKQEFSRLLEEISEKQNDGIQRLLAGGDLNVNHANGLIASNNFESVPPTRGSYPSTAPAKTFTSASSTRQESRGLGPNTDGDLDKTDMEFYRGLDNKIDFVEDGKAVDIHDLLLENDVTDVLKSSVPMKEAKIAKKIVKEKKFAVNNRFMPAVSLENKTKQYQILKSMKKNMVSSPLTRAQVIHPHLHLGQ